MDEITARRKEHVVATWVPGNRPADAVVDVVLMATVPLLVLCSLLLQAAYPPTQWFMKFGGVIVAIGILLEYRHARFATAATVASIKWASGVGGPTIFEQSDFRKFAGYFSHTCVVAGTVIAGFGDVVLGWPHF